MHRSMLPLTNVRVCLFSCAQRQQAQPFATVCRHSTRVFRAGQAKAETLTPSSSTSSRKSKAGRPKQQAKEESLLFEDTADFEFENGYTMRQVCDRLIHIFTQEKTNEVEWRKLLLLGDDWDRLRPSFFKHCKYKASLETNKLKKADLLSLCSKMEKVDAEMLKHKQLLEYVKENWPELDVVVAGRRKEFTNAFFQHMTLLCEASSNRLDRRDDLARIAAKCLAVVEAHDRALEDDVAITIAQQRFDKILDSPSLDEACSKVDKLGEKKQIDSTLMLLFAKAWATAKDSHTMTDEVSLCSCGGGCIFVLCIALLIVCQSGLYDLLVVH
ncbi:hypothetical protein L7F22_008007 [Adiantum nelumboides]|nr:hypothetical protein [Adiantum nelumboides]